MQLLHQKHASGYQDDEGATIADLPLDMGILTSHCCCHAVHNAVKWALGLENRAETGKLLWTVVASIRSSYLELQGGLMDFIHTRCVFGRHPWLLPVEDAIQLYTLMGVAEDMMDLYTQFQPFYLDGALHIACAEDNADVIDEQLAALLLHALKFVGYSDSRWCSLGDSSRCVLLCLSLGLPAMIEIGQTMKKSQFCLEGAEHIHNPELCSLILEASLVTASPDALLTTMLADDRLFMIEDKLVEIMRTEMQYVHGISPLVWQRLLRITGEQRSWPMLRSDVIYQLHIAHSYIYEHVLRVACTIFFGKVLARGRQTLPSPPPPLMLGMPTQSIVSLFSSSPDTAKFPESHASGCPQHGEQQFGTPSCPSPSRFPQFSSSILQFPWPSAGENRLLLTEIPQLMPQICFSTNTVEQAHASLATIARFHRQLSQQNLINRAYCHQMRLTFREAELSNYTTSLERALQTLQRKDPTRVSGRHIFLKGAMEAMRETIGRPRPNAKRCKGCDTPTRRCVCCAYCRGLEVGVVDPTLKFRKPSDFHCLSSHHAS